MWWRSEPKVLHTVCLSKAQMCVIWIKSAVYQIVSFETSLLAWNWHNPGHNHIQSQSIPSDFRRRTENDKTSKKYEKVHLCFYASDVYRGLHGFLLVLVVYYLTQNPIFQKIPEKNDLFLINLCFQMKAVKMCFGVCVTGAFSENQNTFMYDFFLDLLVHTCKTLGFCIFDVHSWNKWIFYNRWNTLSYSSNQKNAT